MLFRLLRNCLEYSVVFGQGMCSLPFVLLTIESAMRKIRQYHFKTIKQPECWPLNAVAVGGIFEEVVGYGNAQT
jgi:hypothetical protein